MGYFKITSIDGKFDHVEGKKAAVARAREMVAAPEDSTEADLEREYGVSISPVSKSIARSVGFDV